jgi:hypothetical protein
VCRGQIEVLRRDDAEDVGDLVTQLLAVGEQPGAIGWAGDDAVAAKLAAGDFDLRLRKRMRASRRAAAASTRRHTEAKSHWIMISSLEEWTALGP